MSDRFPKYRKGQVTFPICLKVKLKKRDRQRMEDTDAKQAHIDLDYHVVPRKGDFFPFCGLSKKIKKVIHFSPLESFEKSWTEVTLRVTLEEMRQIRQLGVDNPHYEGEWHFN